MHDKADGDHPVVIMIEERAAARRAAERPAEAMAHEALLELGRVDLPDLLQADAELLRVAPRVELELGDQLLGERTARALGDQHIFAAQLHAAGEAVLGLAVTPDAHVAGGDADHFALVAIEHFRGREAGIDLDAETFGARAEPAGGLAERADEIAVVVHERRHGPIGQGHAAGGPENHELVMCHRRLQRTVRIVAPVRQQAIEADGIDDRAGENMRPDDRALLDDDHRAIRVELLQPYRGREARGPRADDHDVIFHRLARGQFVLTGHIHISHE